ncbi:MAG: hypothetical protein U0610_25060 [bacterium]
MSRFRLLVPGLALGCVLTAAQASAQIAAFTQPLLNPIPPALEEQRRTYSTWVFPEAKGYEDDERREVGAGGFGGDWSENPYNPVNLKKALERERDAAAAQRAPLTRLTDGKHRRRANAKDPLALTKEGDISGSFDVSVDISTTRLEGSPLTKGKLDRGLELGDITGGGAPRLSIWALDEDRKRMRRTKKVERQNVLESDEEVLIRQQQAEATGGTDFFSGF